MTATNKSDYWVHCQTSSASRFGLGFGANVAFGVVLGVFFGLI